MRSSEVYCRALVRSVSQCSLQAVWTMEVSQRVNLVSGEVYREGVGVYFRCRSVGHRVAHDADGLKVDGEARRG